MLVCPECNSAQLYVVDSRNNKEDYVARRRKCEACGHRFPTVEIPKDVYDDLIRKRNRLRALETALIQHKKAKRDTTHI